MVSKNVQDLMEKMTIQEKIGQLIQLSADFFQGDNVAITGPLKEAHLGEAALYSAGSVLGISGAQTVRKVQKNYLKHSRLGIPLLFMADVVHGYKTIFPIPLALGASFDPQVMKTASATAAKESAAGGVHVTFAPMVDLVRDPRWGRVMESTGEDPYLNSVMAKAAVTGFQGTLPLDQNHIAACVKHFAAYGAPEAGREYNTVDISEWRFREQYLPAYAAAIEAQALLVMTSFNTLFGVPATVNQHLMRDILRDELQFHGVLISDWDAIGEIIHHGVAGDLQHAADLALKAGVDIDMMSFAYAKYLAKAASLDPQIEQLINESAQRILILKEQLGLFTDPYRGLSTERETEATLTTENLDAAQAAAEQSMVLLKNSHHTLPLNTATAISLVGPVADTGDILGSWSWQGDPDQTETIADALAKQFSNFTVMPGTQYHHVQFSKFNDAVNASRQQETIVAVLGLPASESGEATSMTDITLPAEQLTLLRGLAQLNKPLVTIVITGRPLDLTEVDALSDAVLLAWFPGSRGGAAIANVLSGRVDPSGRLPMTFPRNIGQVPIYYNAYNTGRPISGTPADDENKYLSKYIDAANSPLYPFGFGLSYGDFTITDWTLSQHNVTPDQPLTIQATIHNSADHAGTTVVQLYTHQQVGETVRPVKQLQAFKKVSLGADQTQTITLTVPYDQLSTIHSDLHRSTDQGDYTVMLGFDSTCTASQPFTVAHQ
ncbi:glycoside hydrolase family 3 N-terminal domain-containing protein [Schleiferilactobacillus harbinensis]|uniref:glycoside hydrolase family 3 N-terminal domain-containing protein n=1 Tax=Schleiferilactobacillus harbinensis TaxID=304207 RepID=UPI0039EBD905